MNRRRLTPNELQILELICQGKNSAQIGREVHAATGTINGRFQRLKFEFECKTIAQLVAKLIKGNMLLVDKNVNKTDTGDQTQLANFAIRKELLVDLKININKILKTYQEHLL